MLELQLFVPAIAPDHFRLTKRGCQVVAFVSTLKDEQGSLPKLLQDCGCSDESSVWNKVDKER
jgi:hypothetical protein